MTEILIRILEILERFRNARELTEVTTALFGVMLVFGIVNCLLGYRLMRFWMMLGGFAAGCGAGFLLCRSTGTTERKTILAVMLVAGVGLAVVAFLVYRLGVFLIGAGIGLSLSVYVLHPTTSFIFFLCLLMGAAMGALAVRYSREIIIVGTSLVGGVFAGFALSRLGRLPELPYGLAMSAGFALLGLLIQFLTNKLRIVEEPEEEEETPEKDAFDECDEEAYEEAYREMYGDQKVSHILNWKKKTDRESGEEEEQDPGTLDDSGEEIPLEEPRPRTARRKSARPETGARPVAWEDSGLDIPIKEWRDDVPEPTIVVRDRPGRRRKKDPE